MDCLTAGTDQLRDDALSYGANEAEIYCAIAALHPPQHAVDDAVIDLGNRRVTIARPGRGHTDADLVVLAPGVKGERAVVFTGDLLEESGDPAIDADSDVADWPDTLDHRAGDRRARSHLRARARQYRRREIHPPTTGLA